MKWTTEELVVRRLARRADLILARARDSDGETAYRLIDRRTGEPLRPDRPTTLQEAREECVMRI